MNKTKIAILLIFALIICSLPVLAKNIQATIYYPQSTIETTKQLTINDNQPRWTANIQELDPNFILRDFTFDTNEENLTINYVLQFNSDTESIPSKKIFFNISKENSTTEGLDLLPKATTKTSNGFEIESTTATKEWDTLKYYLINMQTSISIEEAQKNFSMKFGQGTTVINFSYEDNRTIRNNTVVDVFIYDTRQDTINLSAVNGVVGDYFVFDGTLDYLTASKSSGTTTTDSGYTLLGWYRKTSNRQPEGLIKTGNTSHQIKLLVNSSGVLEWEITGDVGNIEVCPQSTANVTDSWVFWGVTWNSTNTRTYCNGVLNYDGVDNMNLSANHKMNISFAESGNMWTGHQDEIMWIPRALTSDEFGTIYGQNVVGLPDTSVFPLNYTPQVNPVKRYVYYDGGGWINQQDPRGQMVVIANSMFMGMLVGYDDAYYTTSDWRNNTGATWYEDGRRGLIGRRYVNDRQTNIKTGNGTTGTPEFDLRTGGTMSAWVYKNSVNSNIPNTFAVFYHSNQSHVNSSQDFWMDGGAGTNTMNCAWKTVNGTESGAAVGYGNSSNPAFSSNEWNHWACTFDGVTRSLYLNGVKITNGTTGSASSRGLKQLPLSIGRAYDGDANRILFGSLDEVKLYNRSLTDDEIASDYQRGLSKLTNNITEGLLLYYDFEQWCYGETTVNCITDKSGNDRHGEFESGSQFMYLSYRGSQASFPTVASIVCTTQGVTIFNESGDYWGSYRTTSTGVAGGSSVQGCSMKNGLLTLSVNDGIRVLDFARDRNWKWTNTGVTTGFDVSNSWRDQTYTTATGTALATGGSQYGSSIYGEGNDTYLMACTTAMVTVVNFSGNTTFEDTVTTGVTCEFGSDGSLYYQDGTNLAQYQGLPTADFTPTRTTALSNIQTITADGTNVIAGTPNSLIKYNATLNNSDNITSLIASTSKNVTKSSIINSRYVYVSTRATNTTNEDGGITEIDLQNNITLNNWTTGIDPALPSYNLNAISTWVNSTSPGGYYLSCTNGLYLAGFATAGASLIDWTGICDEVTFTINNPTSNYSTGNAELDVNYTYSSDDNASSTIRLYVDNNINETQTDVENGTTRIISTTGLSEGVHSWFLNGEVTSNSTNTTTLNYIYDLTAPTISSLTNGGVVIGHVHSLATSASDTYSLGSGIVQVTNPSNTSTNYSLLIQDSIVNSTTGYTTQQTYYYNYVATELGTYNITFYIYDEAGNMQTVNDSFESIIDNGPSSTPLTPDSYESDWCNILLPEEISLHSGLTSTIITSKGINNINTKTYFNDSEPISNNIFTEVLNDGINITYDPGLANDRIEGTANLIIENTQCGIRILPIHVSVGGNIDDEKKWQSNLIDFLKENIFQNSEFGKNLPLLQNWLLLAIGWLLSVLVFSTELSNKMNESKFMASIGVLIAIFLSGFFFTFISISIISSLTGVI